MTAGTIRPEQAQMFERQLRAEADGKGVTMNTWLAVSLGQSRRERRVSKVGVFTGGDQLYQIRLVVERRNAPRLVLHFQQKRVRFRRGVFGTALCAGRRATRTKSPPAHPCGGRCLRPQVKQRNLRCR
jgi:hypothetical protein